VLFVNLGPADDFIETISGFSALSSIIFIFILITLNPVLLQVFFILCLDFFRRVLDQVILHDLHLSHLVKCFLTSLFFPEVLGVILVEFGLELVVCF